jgi:hypothetical protein
MNPLTNRQQDMLAQGLAAFDAAAGHRRARRRLVRGAAAACLALGAGVAIVLMRGADARSLPKYVEIIRGDVQLTAELELANACERISRSDGRLVVVECALHPSAD